MELSASIFRGLGAKFDSAKFLNEFSSTLDEEGRAVVAAY
jgi:hypothetical protein